MINKIREKALSRRQFIQASASVATTTSIISSISLPFSAQATPTITIQPDEVSEKSNTAHA